MNSYTVTQYYNFEFSKNCKNITKIIIANGPTEALRLAQKHYLALGFHHRESPYYQASETFPGGTWIVKPNLVNKYLKGNN